MEKFILILLCTTIATNNCCLPTHQEVMEKNTKLLRECEKKIRDIIKLQIQIELEMEAENHTRVPRSAISDIDKNAGEFFYSMTDAASKERVNIKMDVKRCLEMKKVAYHELQEKKWEKHLKAWHAKQAIEAEKAYIKRLNKKLELENENVTKL